MQCEVCGRNIPGKPYRVIIERAKVVTCAECAKLGSGYWTPESEYRPIRRPILKAANKGAKLTIKSQVNSQRINSLEDFEIVEGYGSIIRRAREKMGLTIEDLSKKIGEKESVIKKIENEKIAPDIKLAVKLEHALKIKLLTKQSKIEKVDGPTMLTRRERGITLGEIIQLRSGRKGGKSEDEGHNSTP